MLVWEYRLEDELEAKMEEGIEKGEKIGIEIGIEIGIIKVARKMLDSGMPFSDVIETLELPERVVTILLDMGKASGNSNMNFNAPLEEMK